MVKRIRKDNEEKGNQSVLSLTRTKEPEVSEAARYNSDRFQGRHKIPLPENEKRTLRERLGLGTDSQHARSIASLVRIFRGTRTEVSREEESKPNIITDSKPKISKDNWFIEEE